jgi:phosphonate transport system substrate-binding protein
VQGALRARQRRARHPRFQQIRQAPRRREARPRFPFDRFRLATGGGALPSRNILLPRTRARPEIRYDAHMLSRRTAPALVALAGLACAACSSGPYREVDLDKVAAPVAVRAAPPPRGGATLRVSVAAMLSPSDTYTSYSRLFERLGERLGVQVEFIQRRTYGEVNELLLKGGLDVALVCTGGYLELRNRAPTQIELLAVPERDGKSTYESLVIVPAGSSAQRVSDLAGGRFAFTDELSFSGYAYASKLLRDMGEDPRTFFGSTVLTRSHDRSVSAVAQRLVDGAAVDSLIYEDLVQRDPALASVTRVIHRSPPFGAMPVIASTRLPAELRRRIRDALLALDRDSDAAASLRVLHVDRFVVPRPGLYDAAAAVVEARR